MQKSEVYIGRQPLLDGQKRLFAYELKFHIGMNPNGHTEPATEALIDKIENDIGFAAIVGSYPCVLKLPAGLLRPERIPNFSSDHLVVLAIGREVLQSADVLRNLKALKQKGYQFLLEDYTGDEESDKLSTIVNYAKIRVGNFNEPQLKEMVESLHQRDIKVIADSVETEERYQHLFQLDFDYYLGYFFTNPTVLNNRKLSGNKLNLLQLMAKVNAPQTSFDELTEIISQDVGLSHKLLVAINHPANELPVHVETIADGLKYMGLKRLKFWVNLLMLSNMEDVPQELLTTSLLNAKFCEMMAMQTGRGQEKDSYFLIGLLSHLDAFFQTTMDEVVDALPLEDALTKALVSHEGNMGEILEVLSAMQKGDEENEHLTFDSLGIVQISNNYVASAAWAQQAVMA